MRHVEHRTSIYIEFKTLRYDGQLLYTEQEGSESGRDFLALSIVNGFVEFRYNLGSGLAVLRSLKKIIPGLGLLQVVLILWLLSWNTALEFIGFRVPTYFRSCLILDPFIA